MNWKRLFLCFLVLSLLLAGCGIGSPKTVKVAVAFPLGRPVGPDLVNAAQLALDEADGKAGNVTVELLVLDNTGSQDNLLSPEIEQEVVKQAIDDPEVVAYLGPLATRQAKVSMPLLNKAGIVQVSSSATWPGLTKAGYGPGEPGIYYPSGRRHFFRVVPSDDIQGVAAARWVAQLGYEKIFIVQEDSAYGLGIAGIFELTAQDLGLTILGQESFASGSVTVAEAEEIAERAVAANPDLVYLSGSLALGADKLIVALRQSAPSLPIMGPDAVVLEELITNLSAVQVEGIYGTTVAVPADHLGTPDAAKFLADYQAAYGKDPFPFAVTTYEAMKVLLAAIEQAEKPTREGVLEAMQSLGEYSGVFGTWHFDERGDISLTAISGMQVQNGAWTFAQVVK